MRQFVEFVIIIVLAVVLAVGMGKLRESYDRDHETIISYAPTL